MKILTYCPNCMNLETCEVIDIKESLQVKEELISVGSKVIVCQTCFQEFNNSEYPNKAYSEAFKIYRSMHNLLTPELVKYYRLMYNYSYTELAKKSGVAPERIELIENGALQDKSEDVGLKKAFNL